MPLFDDLNGATEDTIQEIIRQAELYSESQLTAALQSDARAMTFGSVMATLAAGSIAAIVAVSQFSPDGELTYAAVSLSIFFIFSLVSMLFAFRAAEPIDFDFLGNDPENWVDDIKRGLTFKDSLTLSAVHYSQQIKDNNKRMTENTRLLKIGIRVFFFGSITSLTPILHRLLYSIQL